MTMPTEKDHLSPADPQLRTVPQQWQPATESVELCSARRFRDALVEQYAPLARRIAARYRGRGEPPEDLVQVAMLGLLKAAERYEPDRGTEFARYAVPTIMGEIRRHFRDSCWSIRVPRNLQELSLRANDVTNNLIGELGRSPTPAEIAERIGVGEDEVLESLSAARAYSTLSLDAPAASYQPSGPTIAEQISDDGYDPLDAVEARHALRAIVERLPERERRMLILRYFGERTQREIAEELSISQMQVSRLLARTLTLLRAHFVDGVDLPLEWQTASEPQHSDRA